MLRAHVAEAIVKEERKRLALHKEAEQALQSEELAAKAELVIANLHALKEGECSSGAGGRELRLADWARLDEEGQPTHVSVVLPAGAGSPREWAEAAFKKARRMRRGTAAIAELLAKSEGRTRQLDSLARHVDAHTGGLEPGAEPPEVLLDAWAEAERLAARAGVQLSVASGPAATGDDKGVAGAGAKVGGVGRAPTVGRGNSLRDWEGRRFLSPDGVQILVGRNKRENEALALTIARHPDVWMHVRGSPGAHVLVRFSKSARRLAADEPLPERSMQMAADLAVFYSDMSNERRADVSVASPKQLFKPRGAPLGAVGVRLEMPNRVGHPQDVPDECKEARLLSGTSQFDDNLVWDGDAAGAKPAAKRGRR